MASSCGIIYLLVWRLSLLMRFYHHIHLRSHHMLHHHMLHHHRMHRRQLVTVMALLVLLLRLALWSPLLVLVLVGSLRSGGLPVTMLVATTVAAVGAIMTMLQWRVVRPMSAGWSRGLRSRSRQFRHHSPLPRQCDQGLQRRRHQLLSRRRHQHLPLLPRRQHLLLMRALAAVMLHAQWWLQALQAEMKASRLPTRLRPGSVSCPRRPRLAARAPAAARVLLWRVLQLVVMRSSHGHPTHHLVQHHHHVPLPRQHCYHQCSATRQQARPCL